MTDANETAMSNNLQPCPFCGSANLDIAHPANAAPVGVVACRKCGCEGPDAGGPAEHIVAWNTRATAPELAAKLAEALAFIEDFAAEPFPAEPTPHVRHPEDEPPAVTDAETVWAWQQDAKALWGRLQ